MVDSLRITEPCLLTDNTAKLAALDLSASEPPATTLVLLQPLANADTLTACLPKPNPDSASKMRYLNIQPLSLAWRQAVIKAGPTPNLIFDLSLPQPTGPSSSSLETNSSTNGFQKVYWETAPPLDGGMVLSTRDVVTMINTIANGIRVRVDGKVSFGLVFDEAEGVAGHAMKLLRKQLDAAEKEYRKIESGKVAEGVEESGVNDSKGSQIVEKEEA